MSQTALLKDGCIYCITIMNSFVNIPDYPNYSINREGIIITHHRKAVLKNGKIKDHPPKQVSYSLSYNNDKKYFLRRDNRSHFLYASTLIKSAFKL